MLRVEGWKFPMPLTSLGSLARLGTASASLFRLLEAKQSKASTDSAER